MDVMDVKVIIHQPKRNKWFQARLLWEIEFRPSFVKELWRESPKALFKHLLAYAKMGVLAEHKLRKEGSLAEDQIWEVVENLIAPTDMEPESEEIPEEIEAQIMDWAGM
jgi:hypothetical protein